MSLFLRMLFSKTERMKWFNKILRFNSYYPEVFTVKMKLSDLVLKDTDTMFTNSIVGPAKNRLSEMGSTFAGKKLGFNKETGHLTVVKLSHEITDRYYVSNLRFGQDIYKDGLHGLNYLRKNTTETSVLDTEITMLFQKI